MTPTKAHVEAAEEINRIAADEESLFTDQRLAEILARRFPQEGWRPIAEAPRDGTEILGYRKDCGIMIIRWTSLEAFCTESELETMSEEDSSAEDWFCADFVQGFRLDGSSVPTRWRPLPQPPKEFGNCDIVPIDFAQTLERRNVALLEELRISKIALDALVDLWRRHCAPRLVDCDPQVHQAQKAISRIDKTLEGLK